MSTPFDVIVADVKNDGVNRLYVSASNMPVFEWSKESGLWEYSLVATFVTGKIPLFAVGDLHNDGKNRLYWSEFSADGKIV